MKRGSQGGKIYFQGYFKVPQWLKWQKKNIPIGLGDLGGRGGVLGGGGEGGFGGKDHRN